jgi:tRNA-2-methylthio-N6-dimethylallyladenosine synthase
MSTFAVVTFGCQMNQHDTARISEGLCRAGYEETTDVHGADVIVLNTCSVREKAEQKLRSEVGRLARLKRARPELVIGVAGCVAQQEGEKLIRRIPDIDLVVGPDNIHELPEVLRELEQGAPGVVRTVFDTEAPRFLTADTSVVSPGPTAFVTVMKGCDERCSFCIVPTTRGPERYRPSPDILDEIDRLVEAGTAEVTLLGQTVNSYRDPLGQLTPAPGLGEGPLTPSNARRGESDSEFPALLRAIAARTSRLRRLRYTSPHPRHLTWALVRAHQDLEVLPRHVHMPVQSGSNAILRRMIRRYTAEEYIERLETLREAVPGLTVSTDIIVGFPGETEADFLSTLNLVDRVGFIGVFGFKYSQRPSTAALNLRDDIDETEKSRRLEALFERAEHWRSRHLSSLVGTTQRVLCEGLGKTGGLYTGRAERNELVHFPASQAPTGRMLDVRIVEAYRHSLGGELVDSSLYLPHRPRPAPARRIALPVI